MCKARFFGRITPSLDPKTNKTFFHYYIGRLASEELIFEGAAGDEKEAIDTVKGHLQMLAAARSLRRRAIARPGR